MPDFLGQLDTPQRIIKYLHNVLIIMDYFLLYLFSGTKTVFQSEKSSGNKFHNLERWKFFPWLYLNARI